MKRSKQGYVMALVLVVMLLLTSVASIVAATSVRNIETGGASFVQEQARIEAASAHIKTAQANVNEFYSHLESSISEEHDVPQKEDGSYEDGAAYFVSQLNSYIDSYPDSGGTLAIGRVLEPSEGQEEFTVLVSSSVEGPTVEAAILITVSFGERPNPDVPDNMIPTFTVISVEYSSYSIL